MCARERERGKGLEIVAINLSVSARVERRGGGVEIAPTGTLGCVRARLLKTDTLPK